MIRLEDIKNKYPFMYEVNENVYYIGNGVFDLCKSQIVLEYYQRYREKINNIGRENISVHCLTEEDTEALIYLFRKVKAYSSIDNNKESYSIIGEKINLFLESLSQEEKTDLYEQLEDYVHTFQCYNKKF